MPATSHDQQKAAAAALAAKRGAMSKFALKGSSRLLYNIMSEKELYDMVITKGVSLTEHVGDI